MKYTGRISLITIALLISLGIRIFAVFQYNFPAYQIPYVGIIILLLFWKLGEQYDKVKFYSEKDVLTKLNNRRFMIQSFPQLVATANRNQEKLILYFIDVDNFKTINDTYGHDTGDQVLQHIAKVLLFHSQKTDKVVRWAGDEFLIFSPFTEELDIETMINNIKNELRITSKDVNITISVSVGTASYPNDAQNLDDLIHEADINMYKNKSHTHKSNL